MVVVTEETTPLIPWVELTVYIAYSATAVTYVVASYCGSC